jgi:hypothetical protein
MTNGSKYTNHMGLHSWKQFHLALSPYQTKQKKGDTVSCIVPIIRQEEAL